MFKYLIMFILFMCMSTTYAMRCGTHIIQEGDDVTLLIQYCGIGELTTWSSGTHVYVNKDGDGMNYYVHVGDNGIIDRITFHRNTL